MILSAIASLLQSLRFLFLLFFLLKCSKETLISRKITPRGLTFVFQAVNISFCCVSCNSATFDIQSSIYGINHPGSHQGNICGSWLYGQWIFSQRFPKLMEAQISPTFLLIGVILLHILCWVIKYFFHTSVVNLATDVAVVDTRSRCYYFQLGAPVLLSGQS